MFSSKPLSRRSLTNTSRKTWIFHFQNHKSDLNNLMLAFYLYFGVKWRQLAAFPFPYDM